jgi:hypothetical protein
VPALQRLHPTSVAGSLARIRALTPKSCGPGSPGVSGLPGAPPCRPTRSFSLLVRPLVLSIPSSRRKKKSQTSGLLSAWLGSPSFPRAPTCLTFSAIHPSPKPSGCESAAAYFFSSGSLAPYETKDLRLCSQFHPS